MKSIVILGRPGLEEDMRRFPIPEDATFTAERPPWEELDDALVVLVGYATTLLERSAEEREYLEPWALMVGTWTMNRITFVTHPDPAFRPFPTDLEAQCAEFWKRLQFCNDHSWFLGSCAECEIIEDVAIDSADVDLEC